MPLPEKIAMNSISPMPDWDDLALPFCWPRPHFLYLWTVSVRETMDAWGMQPTYLKWRLTSRRPNDYDCCFADENNTVHFCHEASFTTSYQPSSFGQPSPSANPRSACRYPHRQQASAVWQRNFPIGSRSSGLIGRFICFDLLIHATGFDK